jgi:hypothetical protein
VYHEGMDERDDEIDEGETPPAGPRGRVAGFFARIAPVVRPWLEQSALNLKVWIPALQSKVMKSGQVKYRAREHRAGMTWKLILPSQCWHCGTTDGLSRRDFNLSIRAFDGPLAIAGGTFGVAVLLLAVALVFRVWWPFNLGFLLTILGAGLLALKSWREKVKLTLWTCAAHAEEMAPPGVVSDDEDLYLFLPTEELAAKARAEVIAARRREGKYASEIPVDRPVSDGRSPASAKSSPTPPEESSLPTRLPGTRTELPPLKLAGEDDGPAAPGS